MGLFRHEEENIEDNLNFDYLDRYLDYEDRMAFQNDSPYSMEGFAGISFSTFQLQNPTYLQDLTERMGLLSEVYDMLSRKRYARLRRKHAHEEVARRLGYGMLMCHALEAISVDLADICGVNPTEQTVHKRLEPLKGRVVPFRRGHPGRNLYDDRKERILRQALDLTNEIAHPHVIGSAHSYEDLCRFYEDQFRDVIGEHIRGTGSRSARRYLSAMRKRLDKFRIKDRITRTLTRGCLVRQLVECATNRWCYHYGKVPTDASTSTMQIKLSGRLKELAENAPRRRKTNRGSFNLTRDVVSALYELKNKSNPLMHVTPGKVRLIQIRRNGWNVAALDSKVLAECSPEGMAVKLDRDSLSRKFMAQQLLCGFFGWTGVHHFYAGNIRWGLAYVITYMCVTYLRFDPRIILERQGPSVLTLLYLIGPLFDLRRMGQSNFPSRKWGKLDASHVKWFPRLLHGVLIAAHLALLLLIYLQ